MSGSDGYVGGLFHTASPANISRSVKRKRKVKAAGGNPLRSRAAYFRQRRARKAEPRAPTKRDQVAELLAEDRPLRAIAEHLGLTPKAVAKHLEAIRRRLGPQAV